MIKHLFIAAIALFASGNAFAQEPNAEIASPTQANSETEVNNEDLIYVKVEQKAEFPGGNRGLNQFLMQNVVYPKEAMEKGIKGTVIVKFTVNKDGSVSDIEVVRSINPLLDEEAVRVVKLMKGWKPAMNNNKPVRSKVVLPFGFKLVS